MPLFPPDVSVRSVVTGVTTIDFGSTPGTNVIVKTITGQASVLTGSVVTAEMMAEGTATHNAYEHAIAPVRLACGNVVPGVGFDITAVTDWRLTGVFNVRWFCI